MGLIPRYVFADLLKVFLVTLAGMTLFMILIGLAQEALERGLGPEPILRLIPYIIPNALRFSVPGTILFAASMVYGRISANNEIVAIKAIGCSPMTVVWPALILAFIASLVSVWLNDIAVSWGQKGIRRVVIQSVEQIAYGMLRTQRSYSNKRFSISVMRVEDRRLIRPTVIFNGNRGDLPVTLYAEAAELRGNPEENTLSILLTNGVIDVGGKASMVFPDTIERIVPLTDASRDAEGSNHPSYLSLRDIPGEIEASRAGLARLEQSLAAEAAYSLVMGDFESLSGDAWTARERSVHGMQERLHRLHTEPWRRWANGFSCFFFVLVGAPLAIRLKNADFWTSFGLCFLPILALYYPLLIVGVDQAKSGALPPYMVWLGNVILAAIGCHLLRRICRY